MDLLLDTVQGAELDSGIGSGRILRTGLIRNIPLPLWPPDPNVLVNALAAAGMPQKGDKHPAVGYEKYFCKRHIVRPVCAFQCTVTIVYEFLGILTVNDSASLSSVTTQLHPKDFTPLYVYFKPAGAAKKITKLLNLQSLLPMRHLTVAQTVDFEASSDVLASFKCVNDRIWMGLPIGYWLCSGLEGGTQDNGITYSYTAVFSTKETEDWSQLGFMTDDVGHAVYVDPLFVSILRAKPYEYGQDTSIDGLNKVGMFDLADLATIFGIG